MKKSSKRNEKSTEGVNDYVLKMISDFIGELLSEVSVKRTGVRIRMYDLFTKTIIDLNTRLDRRAILFL